MFKVKERDMRTYELALQGAYTKRSNVDIAVIKFQNYDDQAKTVFDMASIAMRDHDGMQFQNGRGDLLFYTSVGSNELVERMRIVSGGNVGLGTSDPQFALDVAGTIRATSWANLPQARNGVTGITYLVDGISTDKYGAATAGVVKFVYDYSQGLSNWLTIVDSNVRAINSALKNNGNGGSVTVVPIEDTQTWLKVTGLSNQVTYLQGMMESFSNVVRDMDSTHATLVNGYSSFVGMFNTKLANQEAFINNFYNSYSDAQAYTFFLNQKFVALSNDIYGYLETTQGGVVSTVSPAAVAALSNDLNARLAMLGTGLESLVLKEAADVAGLSNVIWGLQGSNVAAVSGLERRLVEVKEIINAVSASNSAEAAGAIAGLSNDVVAAIGRVGADAQEGRRLLSDELVALRGWAEATVQEVERELGAEVDEAVAAVGVLSARVSSLSNQVYADLAKVEAKVDSVNGVVRIPFVMGVVGGGGGAVTLSNASASYGVSGDMVHVSYGFDVVVTTDVDVVRVAGLPVGAAPSKRVGATQLFQKRASDHYVVVRGGYRVRLGPTEGQIVGRLEILEGLGDMVLQCGGRFWPGTYAVKGEISFFK